GCVALERNRKNQQISQATRGSILGAGDLGVGNLLSNTGSSLFGTAGIARSYDDCLARPGPAQSQAETFWSGAAEHGDRSRHLGGPHLGELRFQSLLRGTLRRLLLDADAGVGGVSLGRNAPGLENERLEILRAGVLARGGASFARDVLFHQRAAV